MFSPAIPRAAILLLTAAGVFPSAASAQDVTAALAALEGKELEAVALHAVGPGSFTLTLTAGGLELSVRLDRQGARLASVGV